MQQVKELIKEKELIKDNQTIGVAVSGGADSMALLSFLDNLSKENNFHIMAIHINHLIRENSGDDKQLVLDFCNKNNIKMKCFEVDAKKVAVLNKVSLELGARMARYGVFDALIEKKIVGKIALAHHKDDQAETILMNIFRGAGINGLKGMDYVRDSYIRPFLDITKQDILKYIKKNKINFVTDYTNLESEFARNYLRNEIMPLITKKWAKATSNIVSLSKDIVKDDEYIKKQVESDSVIIFDKLAKIPVSYFLQEDAITSRIVFDTLKKIDIKKDIERKHIKLIKELAIKGENGKKLNLPNSLKVYKEYDYIILTNKQKAETQFNLALKNGKFYVEGFGEFMVKKIKDKKLEDIQKDKNSLYFDLDKLPKGAAWRFKNEKDIFTKFGGGTKSLKSYLVDKKVSARKRNSLPLLAFGSEIFVVLGVEISEKIKIDAGTTSICQVSAL